MLFPFLIFVIKKLFFLQDTYNGFIHIILIQVFLILNIFIFAKYLLKTNYNNVLSITIIFILAGYTTTNLRFPVYNDLLVTLLILNSIFTKKYINSSIYFFLACLAHEIVIFSFPFFLFLGVRKYKIKKRNFLILSNILVSIFIIFYLYIKISLIEIYYDRQFDELGSIFSSKANIINHILTESQFSIVGIFSAFKIIWVIFLLMILKYFRKKTLIKNKKIILSLFLYFNFLIILTFFYSIDHTRHAYLLLFLPLTFVMLRYFYIFKNKQIVLFCLISQIIIPNVSVFKKIYIIQPFFFEIFYEFEKIKNILNF